MVPTEIGQKITLVHADKHPVIRAGLEKIFENHPGICLLATVPTGDALIEVAAKYKPDVVLTALDMEGISGMEVTAHITSTLLTTRVLAFALRDEEPLILLAIQAGAKGVVFKDSEPYDIYLAIQTVHAMGNFFPDSTAQKLMQLFAQLEKGKTPRSAKANLSDKEVTIIQLVCRELSNKEIAHRLNLSIRSVESTRERILQKIGARNMVGIVLYALQNQLIELRELPTAIL